MKTVDYLDFFKTIGKSKRLLRTGWVREKIKDPESVAEHSFRVGVLAMVLADKLGVDKEKLIEMALLHDLGETVTGDVVAIRGQIVDLKKREEKEEKEREGTRIIFDKISERDRYLPIFDEMIDGVTRAAKAFWEIDKLEMALQAFEYEEEQGKNLEEFFATADLFIKEPLLRKIFDELLEKRAQRQKGRSTSV